MHVGIKVAEFLSTAICFSGYRHVYLEGMEEASIFVHVAVNDITGKVNNLHMRLTTKWL